jgi:hypothetical protein
MENKIAPYHSGRFFFGLVLLVLGSLYLLDNFGFIFIGHISRYWPVLLILLGIARLLDYDGTSRHGTGVGWIFLGAWFLVSINGMFGLDFHNSWPILIIGWGISLLWKALYRQPQVSMTEEAHHGI